MVTGLHDNKMSLNDSINNTLAFKKKNSRIDWRKIASVDLERVARELDVYTLQDNIDHITYCNIENELDTRLMDPNYVKLFKISQFMIEYLVHSQTYLTDVISTIEGQLNLAVHQNDELKKSNDKISKELIEVKKESKKRKKMIETQQTLMSVTSANYHQCAFCSKVFLNISYLQAHMSRRHGDVDHSSMSKQAIEFDKELERIKERLRITESELMMERNSRLNLRAPAVQSNEDWSQMEKKFNELKNNELKQQKEEYEKRLRSLKREIMELNEKNSKFEIEIKHLQESLSKKSSVGWIKDDVDLEKDSVLKMKKEIDRLNDIISNYEKEIKMLTGQIEDQKTKFRNKEASIKQKYQKEIKEKDDEISRLKAKLEELENTIGKSDNQLRARIQELQDELQQEQQLRLKAESELKNRPPSVTPRQQPSNNTQIPQPVPSHKLPQPKPTRSADIYLPDYCPLTLKELQTNPAHLEKFKKLALEIFENKLDEYGISLNDKGLTQQDFKLKMNAIKNTRNERVKDMVNFNEMRNVFNEVSSKHAAKRLSSSIRSSKVHFKSEITSKKLDDDEESTWIHDSVSRVKRDQSEETDEDVSLPDAFESDEDDTEPTKSILQDKKRGSVSPRKASRLSSSINFDETSELENVSQMTESYRKARSPSKKQLVSSQAKSTVSELKKKVEKQLEARKGGAKPVGAVPIGFKENDDDNSLGSVSDIEPSHRPRSGVRSSFQDSNSSGLWVHESMDANQHVNDRPPTANSSKTLNDTDDITNVD